MNITRPTLLVDEEKCKINIRNMAEKAKKNDTELIPHFKTHQSIAIGEWFKESGVKKITVSSVEMAEFFARGGWTDIYIAFPCNVLEIDRINVLANKISLTLLISNKLVVRLLQQQLTAKVNARIEIDAGGNRTGFKSDDYVKIDEVIKLLKNAAFIEIKGFYSHSGNSYFVKGKKEISSVFDTMKSRMITLKDKFQLPIACGDTPCCSIVDNFEDFESIHPGNFVFYDVMQTQIGSCVTDNIAVALACPVVDKRESRLEITVHGGGVHLSKDNISVANRTMYGEVIVLVKNGWSKPINNCYVKSISQEHGVLKVTQEFYEQTNIGDVIGILPIHSCMTADCMGEYYTLNEEKLDHLKSRL